MNLSNPNIINMVISSIIDHSEDWTIDLVSGDATIHVHKSGIGIWAYLNTNDVRFWKPEYARGIQISREEKILLFNAIEKDRVEKKKNICEKATKRLVKQFTGTKSKSWFARLFR